MSHVTVAALSVLHRAGGTAFFLPVPEGYEYLCVVNKVPVSSVEGCELVVRCDRIPKLNYPIGFLDPPPAFFRLMPHRVRHDHHKLGRRSVTPMVKRCLEGFVIRPTGTADPNLIDCGVTYQYPHRRPDFADISGGKLPVTRDG